MKSRGSEILQQIALEPWQYSSVVVGAPQGDGVPGGRRRKEAATGGG